MEARQEEAKKDGNKYKQGQKEIKKERNKEIKKTRKK